MPWRALAFDDYRRGDCAATLADVARIGETFFFVSPALVAMCQAELDNHEAARRALAKALALDPTFARDPRGAYRLLAKKGFSAGLRRLRARCSVP